MVDIAASAATVCPVHERNQEPRVCSTFRTSNATIDKLQVVASKQWVLQVIKVYPTNLEKTRV
jgi:hypothetical protein